MTTSIVVRGVHGLLTEQGGMVCDGGGCNAHLDVTARFGTPRPA
jgi:hypothetical protein